MAGEAFFLVDGAQILLPIGRRKITSDCSHSYCKGADDGVCGVGA